MIDWDLTIECFKGGYWIATLPLNPKGNQVNENCPVPIGPANALPTNPHPTLPLIAQFDGAIDDLAKEIEALATLLTPVRMPDLNPDIPPIPNDPRSPLRDVTVRLERLTLALRHLRESIDL